MSVVRSTFILSFLWGISLVAMGPCRDDLSILVGETEVPFGESGRFVRDRSVTLPRIRLNDRALAVEFLTGAIYEIGFEPKIISWTRHLSPASQEIRLKAVAREFEMYRDRIEQGADPSTDYFRGMPAAENLMEGILKRPVEIGDTLKFKNIVVDVPGTQSDGTHVLVGAHYDVVNSEGKWMDSNPSGYLVTQGALDNGTGVVGLLALLRRLKEDPPETDVRVVFFDSEESTPYTDGLIGSHYYARKMKRPRTAIILDMIGGTGKPGFIYGHTPYPPLESIFLEKQKVLGEVEAFHDSDDLIQSDSHSFSLKGIPTLLLGDQSSPEAGRYHTSRDTIDHVNFDQLMIHLEMTEALIRRASDIQLEE